jgi:hypothetical protein
MFTMVTFKRHHYRLLQAGASMFGVRAFHSGLRLAVTKDIPSVSLRYALVGMEGDHTANCLK